MLVIGKTDEGMVIAVLNQQEEAVCRAVMGVIRPAPIMPQTEELIFGPARVRQTKIAAALLKVPGVKVIRKSKLGKAPRYVAIQEVLEKGDRPMSVQEISEATGLGKKAVADVMCQCKERFQKTGYGMYAALSWVAPKLDAAGRMLVDAEPDQLTAEAKARRLELLKQLGKKAED